MARLLSAYEGASFIVVEPSGDIREGQEAGLYHLDTRFLSRHTLRLGGTEPLVLSSRSPAAHMLVVFATNAALPGVPRGALVLRRSYAVGTGMHCDIDIESHGPEHVELELELAYDADFADVFEVKRLLESPEPSSTEPATLRTLGRAVLALARGASDGWSRRTELRFSLRPQFDGRTVRFRVSLAPRERFHLCQDVFTIAGGDFAPPRYRCGGLLSLLEAESPLPSPIRPRPDRPVLRSGDAVLDDAFAQATADLFALRVRPPEGSTEDFHLAAGVPWYMALFGRDSLIAASQAMPYMPDLARGVLRSLARWQGRKDDPETEEQPGKILHEYRPPGLLGARRFVPRFPYYGTADATPLFVIVLAEYWRRTGDLAFVRALEKNLAAAVGWIVRACDAGQGGFITYRRSTAYGLWNQGWKDSEDSIRFRDGRQAEPPIALVEVQGYACEALLCAGALYRALGRPEAEASALEARSVRLRDAIDDAFWMEDRGFWALALDGHGRQVDALASNGGHLLWSGAAVPSRARRAADVLLGAEMFSGFGVRTMGRAESAFSPISYHNGSVWPHDTSLVIMGLARYGFRDEAVHLSEGMRDAVGFYADHRLPELFAGIARDETPFPVEYPTSNSPQAWAAGAILLAVTAMLGLGISVPERTLVLRPTLPEGIAGMVVSGIEIAGAKVQVEVQRRPDGGVAGSVRGAPQGFTCRA